MNQDIECGCTLEETLQLFDDIGRDGDYDEFERFAADCYNQKLTTRRTLAQTERAFSLSFGVDAHEF